MQVNESLSYDEKKRRYLGKGKTAEKFARRLNEQIEQHEQALKKIKN